MRTRFGVVAWECLLDLGVTVVYAAVAGLLIVGIVASDDSSASIAPACLYALLLPMAAVTLIGVEIVFRVFKERRETRRALYATSSRGSSHGTPLGLSRCP